MGNFGEMDAIGMGMDYINSLIQAVNGGSGYKTAKEIAIQENLNKNMSQWNIENVTKPVFQMESEEWNRRFNAQNEYESAAAQIQRMREAGLNPAMLQGETGAMPAGNPNVNEAASQMAEPADYARLEQGQLAKQQSIAVQLDNITKPILNWGNIRLQNANINVAKSEYNWKEADKQRAQELCKVLGQQAEYYANENRMFEEKLQELKSKIVLLNEQGLLTHYQGEREGIQYELEDSAATIPGEEGRNAESSFLALMWRKSKYAALQKTISESQENYANINYLKELAKYTRSAEELNNIKIPILKIQGGNEALNFGMNYSTYDKRKENILGTLDLKNGILNFKSKTYPMDYWIGWGESKLKQGLNLLDLTDRFKHNWLFNVDNNLERAGKLSGILSGAGLTGGQTGQATPSYRDTQGYEGWENSQTW